MSDPRYATAPTPGAQSRGAQVAVVAEALGTPLMPWQRHVVDVALELDPRHTGPGVRWRYPVVVLTVPRQSGKSTLVRAVAVHRAVTRRRARVFATAQRGKDARDLWKELVERVEDGPLASAATVLRGAGSETLRFPNGSEIRPFAPTRDSLHGKTPDLVFIDEAWAFDAAKGEDLMAAVRPAQITLPDRQLWIVSTAGDADSAFLREWVETGRASVDDPGSGVAYFEWSAAEGADPYDPATWAFHPALGHTIDQADIAAEAEGSTRGNFERAHLNRWTTTSETVVDLDRFDELANPLQQPPDPKRMAMAYDVAHDRSSAAIWAAWPDDDGTVQLRAYLVRPGAAWLPGEVASRVVELGPAVIAADDGGPARQVTDELRRRGVTVETMSYRDYGTACGAFMAAIHDGALGHDGSPALRSALERASVKFVSDQVGWDRRRSAGDISPLIAATVAAWFATHAPTPAPRPMIRGA